MILIFIVKLIKLLMDSFIMVKAIIIFHQNVINNVVFIYKVILFNLIIIKNIKLKFKINCKISNKFS